MNILVSRSYCQLFEKNDFYLFILSLKVPYLLFIDQMKSVLDFVMQTLLGLKHFILRLPTPSSKHSQAPCIPHQRIGHQRTSISTAFPVGVAVVHGPEWRR